MFLFYQKINEKGETETVLPKTVEQAGLDKEPKVTQRNLPIDEFRYGFPKYLIRRRLSIVPESLRLYIHDKYYFSGL